MADHPNEVGSSEPGATEAGYIYAASHLLRAGMPPTMLQGGLQHRDRRGCHASPPDCWSARRSRQKGNKRRKSYADCFAPLPAAAPELDPQILMDRRSLELRRGFEEACGSPLQPESPCTPCAGPWGLKNRSGHAACEKAAPSTPTPRCRTGSDAEECGSAGRLAGLRVATTGLEDPWPAFG